MARADATETRQDVDGPQSGQLRTMFWGLLVLTTLLGAEAVYWMKSDGSGPGPFTTLLPATFAWSLVMCTNAFRAWRRPALDPSAVPNTEPTTDSRTGLFTMEYLKTSMELERRRSQEIGVSAAVVYLDLVHLDRVNHLFGHTVGDIVLKALAGVIAEHIRPGDILGHVGGDEFMIVMPETRGAEALPVAEQIEQAVADYTLDLGKKGIIDFVECKSGVANFPAEGRSAEEVAAAARRNMQVPQPA